MLFRCFFARIFFKLLFSLFTHTVSRNFQQNDHKSQAARKRRQWTRHGDIAGNVCCNAICTPSSKKVSHALSLVNRTLFMSFSFFVILIIVNYSVWFVLWSAVVSTCYKLMAANVTSFFDFRHINDLRDNTRHFGPKNRRLHFFCIIPSLKSSVWLALCLSQYLDIF